MTFVMLEPQLVLKDAVFDVIREAAEGLRKRGWAVELIVDYVAEKHTFAVSLRYELPSMLVPVESQRGA